MSYFKSFWQKSGTAREQHEKAWNRAKAVAWDEKWQALSVPAREAYLNRMKAPSKEGSFTHLSTPLDKLPPDAVKELVAAGFVRMEEGIGKRGAKVLPLSDAYDFSARIRAMQRYQLLDSSTRENLVKYCKYVFFNQGELIIERVLSHAKIGHVPYIEDGLENYVTTGRWPAWALDTIKAKAARPLADVLRKAGRPVSLTDLPKMVKGFKPDDVREAFSELVTSLVVFEGLDPSTLELTAGFLPIVRERLVEAEKPRVRPPLVACEEPRDIGPLGGLELNDLRVFLLEVVGEAPRLRQDGGIFQKEEARFLAALPPRPEWLDTFLNTSVEGRLEAASRYSKLFGFVEVESEDKATWLQLSGKGKNWLASTMEEQYLKVFNAIREIPERPSKSYDYNYSFDQGDSKFLGLSVVIATKKNSSYYYDYLEASPAHRQALRESLRMAFEELPIGVFYTFDSVVAHLSFGKSNPLMRVGDPEKLSVYLDRRPLPNLPERWEGAGRLAIEAILLLRLIPYDAFRPAIDDEGRFCIARLARSAGYFGRAYESDVEVGTESTRVIVQPDYTVVVIGMDPAPIAELAPFCDRVGGHAGQGVLTLKITRDAVIRASTQGLSGPAIVARLKKHASVDVPENVLKEVVEWAGWIRHVNVRPITVVRCPDAETVARVVSALGKKAERLNDNLVALHVPKLSGAERQKLQEQGILISKQDIDVPIAPESPAESPPAKKRGRPKKAR